MSGDASARQATRPIRVAFVIGQLGAGGSERQLALLVENLDRAEFDARVYTFTRGGRWADYLLARGFEVRVIPRRGHRDPTRTVRLHREFRAWRPNVVFSVMSDAHLYATPAAMLAGVNGIAVHSGTVGARWELLRTWLERALVPWVDVRVGNARAVSRDMNQRLGDDARRHWTVYNAIDWEPFAKPDRAAARQLLGAGEGDFLVGFIASFSEEKRHDLAVRALAAALPKAPRLRLVMLGDGPQLEKTRELAASLGVAERCVFAGFRPDVPRVLPAFDVTINCSRREGCCNAILESLAAGVPVIASAVGGSPELVKPGVNGLLFPYGQAAALASCLESVAGGGVDLAAWGRAGREFVQRDFTLAAYLAEMRRLLAALGSLPRRRPFMRAAAPVVQASRDRAPRMTAPSP